DGAQVFAALHLPNRGDDAVLLNCLVSNLFRVLICRRCGISLSHKAMFLLFVCWKEFWHSEKHVSSDDAWQLSKGLERNPHTSGLRALQARTLALQSTTLHFSPCQ